MKSETLTPYAKPVIQDCRDGYWGETIKSNCDRCRRTLRQCGSLRKMGIPNKPSRIWKICRDCRIELNHMKDIELAVLSVSTVTTEFNDILVSERPV